MARRFSRSANQRQERLADEHEQTTESARRDHGLNGPNLEQIAQSVATGELPLPRNFTPEQLHRLVGLVRQLRRDRLVEYIARSIASDIRRSTGHDHEST